MKVTLTILLILGTLFSSCTTEQFDCSCDTTHVSETDSILKLPDLDSMMNRISAKYGQKPINQFTMENYRFSSRGACSGESSFYHLTEVNSGADLSFKYYQGPNNKSTGHNIVEQGNYHLDETEWLSFKRMIDTTCFWTMAIDQGNQPFFGGTTWMVEGFQPDKRNCANRDIQIVLGWIPDSSAFTNICQRIKSYAKQ